uniref:Uncharacterized protein n=1 Tax=Cacopsylla melanoneura TaxID=428564 RepID=A0A8D9APA8_9HEMI
MIVDTIIFQSQLESLVMSRKKPIFSTHRVKTMFFIPVNTLFLLSVETIFLTLMKITCLMTGLTNLLTASIIPWDAGLKEIDLLKIIFLMSVESIFLMKW